MLAGQSRVSKAPVKRNSRRTGVFCFAPLLATVISACAASASPRLSVPSGFTIEPIASVGGARELAALPNGDLVVGTAGRDVYLVPDAESNPGRPRVLVSLPDDLAAGVTFAAQRSELLVATTNHVWASPIQARAPGFQPAASPTFAPDRSRRVPTATCTIRRRLPLRRGSSTSRPARRATRRMNGGTSPCVELDPTRAAISVMEASGSGFRQRAKRIRNGIALAGTRERGGVGRRCRPGRSRLRPSVRISRRPLFARRRCRLRLAGMRGESPCVLARRGLFARRSRRSSCCPRTRRSSAGRFIPPASGCRTRFRRAIAAASSRPRTARGIRDRAACHAAPPQVVFIPMNGDMPAKPVDWNEPADASGRTSSAVSKSRCRAVAGGRRALRSEPGKPVRRRRSKRRHLSRSSVTRARCMTTRLAILVGGGPAPGINGVIASAAIEAFKCGLRVLGIYDGYRDLAAGRTPKTIELTFDHVSRIHTSGGSILRTSRTNPAADEATLRTLRRLARRLGRSLSRLYRRRRYDVRCGQDCRTNPRTHRRRDRSEDDRQRSSAAGQRADVRLRNRAFGRRRNSRKSHGGRAHDGALVRRRQHGPKVGFAGAGHVQGGRRNARRFARGVPEGRDVASVVDTIVGAIVKRRSLGRQHGIAVVAEGIVEGIPASAFATLERLGRDAFGNIRLADVPIGIVLRDGVRRRLDRDRDRRDCRSRRISATSCAAPSPSRSTSTTRARWVRRGSLPGRRRQRRADRALGRTRGAGRARRTARPQTGRIRTRQVDITTEAYRVARDYMVCLDRRISPTGESSRSSPRRRTSARKPSARSSNRPRSLALSEAASPDGPRALASRVLVWAT